ncbi:putative nuclease HARBI1 [Cucumis melo var. makuwa]|uniref:Putative nuclease HARBI1 n=1 Tax=Cucumis melo var. makuwa TaxID=1194695 RepID=A0A5D3CJ14_CUCMM|nr:putative nuclease HARBI1 [Cucumis melo var. makuwa]
MLKLLMNDHKRLQHTPFNTRTTSGLASTEVVDVEEMVVMFLDILAHDVKNRMIEREFVWSADSRILKDATSRPNELRVLKVKYLNVEDFLALFRGQRYHLHEWHGVGDSTYATTAYDNIHYIEASNEWSQWTEDLAQEMLSELELHRATGARAETFANVGSNLPRGFEEFPANDANDLEIPMMYSQGLNMSPDKLMWTVMRSVQGMKSFLRIPSELKLEYYTVLLEDNA